MNSETVDLIATDPPFNKGCDFHQTWVDQITDDFPKLMAAIESARYANSDGVGAYMCFMAVRLLEMRRVLKPTGSIYLHCAPTASHYLKAIMDAIFVWRNFINEIVLSYRTGGASKRQFSRKHDMIFLYTKGNGRVFNSQREKSYTKAVIRKPEIVDYGGGNAEFFKIFKESIIGYFVEMFGISPILYRFYRSREIRVPDTEVSRFRGERSDLQRDWMTTRGIWEGLVCSN